jgi:hypothetical protein
VQEDYDAVAPDPANAPPPRPDAVGDLADEIESTDHFENIGVRRCLWEVAYTASGYIDVLDTYSGHRAMNDATRQALYELIRRRIDSRPNKTVEKSYLATLNVARRL